MNKPQQNINNKPLITLTKQAVERIRYLMTIHTQETSSLLTLQEVIGIRIIITRKGCAGLKYNIEYAYEIHPLEYMIDIQCSDEKNIKVLLDSKSLMFIIGTEMDYIEEKFSSGFHFKNPNEKGRCGCGESFIV
ncbi:HesB/IscA family protein [Wolbachia endosymbiont of Howardula sp.]|uniref:HesB/IscA family protein n=1 Tax=Wolbachia endosymbiont of Howardula sp. TaxID=2916816 RepID=UPI00217EE321|nr:iron-sulfur cluster assembly accessory protein [Wolbachia endosymbiont of Howardula sp.]UWI83339.1 iron-sulfur cluster assembly accessory protein [Wolbachia endosymbiont of Howardula sp.]